MSRVSAAAMLPHCICDVFCNAHEWSRGLSRASAVVWLPHSIHFQDVRGRVSQTSFSPAAVWKRPFFPLQIFAVGENLEWKRNNVPLCRRRKGKLTRPPRKSYTFSDSTTTRLYLGGGAGGPQAPPHGSFLVRRGAAAPHQKGDVGRAKPHRASRPTGCLVVVIASSICLRRRSNRTYDYTAIDCVHVQCMPGDRCVELDRMA